MHARAATLLIVVTACGRFNFDARRSGDGSDATSSDGVPADACTFSAWGTPSRITELASGNDEWGAQITHDGLTLYYNVAGNARITTRSNRSSPFAPGTALPELGSAAYDPTPRGDELELYTDDGQPNSCIYVSTRPNKASAWSTRVATALCTNSIGPFLTADGLSLYYNTTTAGNWPAGTIMVATRSSLTDAFVPGTLVAGLSGETAGSAVLTDDGLQIFFEITQPQFQILTATRSAITAPFSPATAITEINTVSDESDVSITGDGLELFYASNQPGGSGGNDLYHVTRTCM